MHIKPVQGRTSFYTCSLLNILSTASRLASVLTSRPWSALSDTQYLLRYSLFADLCSAKCCKVSKPAVASL